MSHSDGKTMGEQAFLYIAVRSENSSTLTKKNFTISRVRMHLPFDPAIPLVEIYSEDTLPQVQNKAQKLLIAISFVMAKYLTTQMPVCRRLAAICTLHSIVPCSPEKEWGRSL